MIRRTVSWPFSATCCMLYFLFVVSFHRTTTSSLSNSLVLVQTWCLWVVGSHSESDLKRFKEAIEGVTGVRRSWWPVLTGFDVMLCTWRSDVSYVCEAEWYWLYILIDRTFSKVEMNHCMLFQAMTIKNQWTDAHAPGTLYRSFYLRWHSKEICRIWLSLPLCFVLVSISIDELSKIWRASIRMPDFGTYPRPGSATVLRTVRDIACFQCYLDG